MVSSDGFVKILDFGLAKLVAEAAGTVCRDALTMAGRRREPASCRHGRLHVAGAGERRRRSTSARTSSRSARSCTRWSTGKPRVRARDGRRHAVGDPPRGAGAGRRARGPRLRLALRWVIERCLAKEPEERYASTRDLARDLATLRDHLSESVASETAGDPAAQTPAHAAPGWRLVRRRRVALVVGGALRSGSALERKPPPSYRQLTFRAGHDPLGAVRSRRADGRLRGRLGGPAARALHRPAGQPRVPLARPARRQRRSPSRPPGEMALVLAQPLSRSVSRVRHARPHAAGGRRRAAGDSRGRLLGRLVSRRRRPGGRAPRRDLCSGSSTRSARSSTRPPDGSATRASRPTGDRVAFLDHPSVGDDRGTVALVDRAGKRTLGGKWATALGPRLAARRKRDLVHGGEDRRQARPSGHLAFGRERLVASGRRPA